MEFSQPCQGVFLRRENRFIALCEIDGRTERVHVKNTGRLRELLLPGAAVVLSHSDAPDRKTAYDLRCVQAADGWVCIDSQIPNQLAKDCLPGLLPGLRWLQPEQRYGASRFDFAFETDAGRGFVEVKGVTLLRNSVALFPDAPTERGARHLRELARARQEGYEAMVLFLIQRKGARVLQPNRETHPDFANALAEAAEADVRLCAMDCRVTERETVCDAQVPVILTTSGGFYHVHHH